MAHGLFLMYLLNSVNIFFYFWGIFVCSFLVMSLSTFGIKIEFFFVEESGKEVSFSNFFGWVCEGLVLIHFSIFGRIYHWSHLFIGSVEIFLITNSVSYLIHLFRFFLCYILILCVFLRICPFCYLNYWYSVILSIIL